MLLALGLSTATYAAGFTPIPLNPTSFNQDVVIEAGAPHSLIETVTATMDAGTNKTGNTWYEMGYNPAAPTTGVPAAGSTFSDAGGTHTYMMPPDYHVNDVIMVGHNNGGRTPIIPFGTLTFTTPAAFAGLSFLTASGNGPVTVGYVIHYADSSTEPGTFTSLDWFNGAANVHNAAGRVNIDGGGVQNVNGSPAGAMFAADIPVANSAVNITSIDFFYQDSNGNTNNNGRAVIFAVSGSGDGVNFTTPIAVTGFNEDAVVEADGPQTTGTGVASAGDLTNNITATMDGGTTKANNCWYERGYYTTQPTTGLPVAGSTITSLQGLATYVMPLSYATNCAVVLAQDITNANIAFAAPGAFGALSFLCATANGDTSIPCIINFADGTTETNAIFVPDWFNRVLPPAYLSFGRINPNTRGLNNSLEQFVNPFATPSPGFDFRGLGLPVTYLFDAVVNVSNSSGVITNISLNFTNGASSRVAAIFAVSGAPANQVPPVFGYRGSATPGQPADAARNTVNRVNLYQGETNLVLAVTNIAGTGPVSYQWMKAASGQGLHDDQYSIDYNLFANVTDGGRISGSSTSVLTISNADLVDSGDYLVVASNPYGSVTSLVATVMIMTTNQNVLSGVPAGDVLTPIAADASPAAESIDHVIDQQAQKWLSDGLQWNGTCCGGPLPFVGPIGFAVTPVAGASIVSSVRIFTANDSTGRDPFDFTLEGSNDGSTWTRIAGATLKGTLSLPTGRNGSGSAGLDPIAGYASEIDFANSTGYKMYRYSITNNYNTHGDALMQVAEVQLLGTLVPNPPVWVRQPESSVTVYAGTSPTFTVEASGYPPPTFQWYRNGTLIPGATLATYTLPNAQLADSGATFSCHAINTFGTITSSSATLNVIAAPTQPFPTAVLADHPLGYWRLDEPDDALGNDGVTARDYSGGHDGYYSNTVNAVQGYNPTADPDTASQFGTFATANSYVANIQDVDFARPTNAVSGGVFSVEAWANAMTPAGDTAIVTKGYAGALTVGTGTGTEQFVLDTAANTAAGGAETFRFMVRDAAGNGYYAQSTVQPGGMWHHLVGVCDQPNGHVYLYVDGMLAASGQIPPTAGILAQPLPMEIGARQSGGANPFDQQWVGVIDDVAVYPSALGAAQALSHFYAGEQPPIFTVQPTNSTVADNISATLYSSAYGAGTVSYQWYNSDGVNPTTPIAGATSANYTFTTTPALNSTLYQVVAANAYGSTTSSVALLTVDSGAPTFITDLPSSQTVNVGHPIQLHIVAGGTAPFTYQWQRNGVNLTDDYRTSGSQTDTLIIGYGAFTDSGNYTVTVTGQGSTTSTSDALIVTNASAFFGATDSGWSLQGTTQPVLANDTVQLTAGLGSTARSAFLTTKQNITSFNVSFVYQDVSGSGGADGATFCIQNQGPTALGGGGGSLGVSGITPSVELCFNIYNPNTMGISFNTGGNHGPFTSLLPNVNIGGNTNQVRVDISYDGTVMNAKFTDLVTGLSTTASYTVNIPSVLGSTTAWVGFTGADGGVSSTQTITWAVPPAQVVPATPIPLTVSRAGGNLVLSWPASAGAYLQTAPALNGATTWSNDTTDQFRLVNDQAQVTVTPGNAGQFFRLQLFP